MFDELMFDKKIIDVRNMTIPVKVNNGNKFLTGKQTKLKDFFKHTNN